MSYMKRRHSATIDPEALVFLPGMGVGLNLIARMAERANVAVLSTLR